MSVNRLSLEITDAQKTAVSGVTGELADKTEPFNVAISKEEMKSLPKIADGRLPFVEKCAEFCVSNPEFLPPFADVPEFQKDVKAYKDTREMARPIRIILENLENAMMVAGSEAWYAALNYYRSVQYHAKMGVPGAQTILDELRPLFEQRTRTEDQPNP